MVPLIPSDKIWIFGVLLNVTGSILINLGTNLMKSFHSNNGCSTFDGDKIQKGNYAEDNHSHASDPNKTWKLGVSLYALGSIVNFVSFAFAAQSLLACLGTVQFISNVFFAKIVLKETLTPRIIYATAVIIFGLTVAIAYSNHEETEFTAIELWQLYNTKYIIFLLIESCILIILEWIYVIYIRNANAGIVLTGHHVVVPSCFSLISATIGTQSLLQSKCMAELLKATIEGDNQLTNGFTYVIILGFVGGISFWLYRMNSALKQFEGLIIIPLLQVFWTTSAILQGGMYFQEFEKFTVSQTIGFSSGVVIVFVGVYVLVSGSSDNGKIKFDLEMKLSNVDDYELSRMLSTDS